MLKKLQQRSSENLHTNPWWEYRHDRYLHPDDSEGEFFYIHTKGSVVVIPELDGDIVLLRQFRYLNQRMSLEFVGGGMKEGVSAEEVTRKELKEEARLVAGNLIPIGSFNPMNGATDEISFVFIASRCVRTQAQPEPSEEFEECLVTPLELEERVRHGEIWDGMTLAAYSLYKTV